MFVFAIYNIILLVKWIFCLQLIYFKLIVDLYDELCVFYIMHMVLIVINLIQIYFIANKIMFFFIPKLVVSEWMESYYNMIWRYNQLHLLLFALLASAAAAICALCFLYGVIWNTRVVCGKRTFQRIYNVG